MDGSFFGLLILGGFEHPCHGGDDAEDDDDAEGAEDEVEQGLEIHGWEKYISFVGRRWLWSVGGGQDGLEFGLR